MERDARLEQIFIMSIAEVEKDKDFIVSALTLMDTDDQRKKIIEYITKNKNINKKDIQKKMAYVSVGLE